MFGINKWLKEKFGISKAKQVKQTSEQKHKPASEQAEVQVEEVLVKEHKPKRRRNGNKRRASKKAVTTN